MGHGKTEAKANQVTITILDTPEQIELFRLFQLKYALKIEIDRERHSPPPKSLKRTVEETLIRNGWLNESDTFITKQQALNALDTYIETKTKPITNDPA
jgi:hypothetical protein